MYCLYSQRALRLKSVCNLRSCHLVLRVSVEICVFQETDIGEDEKTRRDISVHQFDTTHTFMLTEEGDGLFESARERNKSELFVIRSCSSVSSSTAGDLPSWLILKYAKKNDKAKKALYGGHGPLLFGGTQGQLQSLQKAETVNDVFGVWRYDMLDKPRVLWAEENLFKVQVVGCR